MDSQNSCFKYYWTSTKYSTKSLYDLVIYDDVMTQEEGNEDMEKKFAVQLPGSFKYKTYEEAEKVAKQYTSTNSCDYVIAQAVASTLQPVPAIEVVKF